jgi:hypothetical protein
MTDVRGDMTSDLFMTVPSIVCLGIVLLCVIAVLVAPERYIRPSFLVMFVTLISYSAILIITLAGSFNPTSDSTTTISDTSTTSSDSSDSASPSAPPPSDGSSDGY